MNAGRTRDDRAGRRIDVDQYKYGFVTDIESDKAPKGLSEDIVRFISAKKTEPEWMLAWRLEAYRRWLTMREPTWARVDYPKINYQDYYYYSAPKKKALASLDEVDPEILRTYEKLGIPLREQELLAGVVRPEGERRVAVDAVFDSVSVATTFQAELKKSGVIFMPISEALREHPDLVKKYLGTVVPTSDNFFATLNSAVFSDGSFVYVPPGVRCPMELSTYFRINEKDTGQFERTLIIADKGSYVSYLEGCTAPMRDENQLHAAVVELVALDDAEIKYSTVQNWYPGDANGKGGIYNFVTKRGDCRGDRSKISWTQVETGSAITWKYPSCILRGDNSSGEFYSIAISNGRQQVDSGTKMLHLGKNTSSRIISKGIAAGKSNNTYRGQVMAHRKAKGARNFTNCDSLLDRRRLRRAYRALHRSEEFLGGVRARSDHLEDLRGDAVLLPPARPFGRGGGGARRQRLRQGRAPAAPDGVRGRSAEAHLDQPRRLGRLRPVSSGESFMSALDKAVAELDAKRSRDDAERRARQEAATAFLKEFFDADLAPSTSLKESGVQAVFDGKRILLTKPEEGVYAEGMMIVVGEQGEIDVSGRSLGPVYVKDKEVRKKELIAEIISHFSL